MPLAASLGLGRLDVDRHKFLQAAGVTFTKAEGGVSVPKKDATCDRCGARAIVGWSCPACDRFLCNVCCGRSKSGPEDAGGFTVQSFSMAGGSCPYCTKKWWQFWK
jgi:hypothetical protein